MGSKIFSSSAAVAIVVGNLLVGCGGGGNDGNIDLVVTTEVNGTDPEFQPPEANITGTSLACDPITNYTMLPDNNASDFNASWPIMSKNVSSTALDDPNRENPTASNTLIRLSEVVDPKTAGGDPILDTNQTHPLLVSYLQQVAGTYEMGDGSADIADPTHVDGVFTALSMDNGDTWKRFPISDTSEKSSTTVKWAGDTINYPGHAQKPTMAVNGNNILIAWNDKYCPSGNPLDLPQDENNVFYTDYFSMVGPQGSIDYTADDGTVMIAPNGKEVYEVPFSCVWTARGIFNPADGNITWHAPMQLTSGKRDSNHIKIAASTVGFAMAWQEDTEGLRAGKGAGPGVGWSGATTNHGTDIWYTSIKMEDFNDTNDTLDGKPKSLYNFNYPVRITDNETCNDGDTKLYCQPLCDTVGYTSTTTNNNAESTITRCMTWDTDMLTDTQVVLDGDTGASRPALNILKTDVGEFVVVMGYEETKGLSEEQTGSSETNIELEGKAVYFESFLFNALDDFNASDPETIKNVAMPLVSAGNVVNVKVPAQDDPDHLIYQNARRLVIGTQVDACDAGEFTFGFLYKDSHDTQGASSDMFLRVNNGFTYDSFVALNDGYGNERNVTNVSAQYPQEDVTAATYMVDWNETLLGANTYDNGLENTFSPRILLRGNDIHIGYAYTPSDAKTLQGNMPSNFHVHRYIDGQWKGPQNVSGITKADVSAVDPRFFTTPKGTETGLDSDKSNPDVFFVTWGVIEGEGEERTESDLFYKRSTDKGANWDENATKLAAREGTTIEEMAVQSLASADGRTIYNVWLQETSEDTYLSDPANPFYGVDTWFGRVDYNISK